MWQIISDSCGYGFNCVSGKTKIKKLRKNSNYDLTVEEMYQQTNEYEYGYALSMFDDETIRVNKILHIVPAGVRQTFEIKTKSGKSIVCTDNHKFPTPHGKKRLDELQVGDLVYCMGDYKNGSTCQFTTYLDSIVSIIPSCVEITYDIEMADPAHTFISENGLVVSNSAHAYCMALDSLYCAYLKAHYPYEFYEVLMQHYADKGNKDKVALLKKEAKVGFGIDEGEYGWGKDNRCFRADRENHVIYPALPSLKGFSSSAAKTLYSLSQKKYDHIYDILVAIENKKKDINSGKLDTLVKIGYFKDFAGVNKMIKYIEVFRLLYGRSQFDKTKVPSEYLEIIKKYSNETEKQYRNIDFETILKSLWDQIEDTPVGLKEQLNYELECLGYVKTILPKLPNEYVLVTDYECKFKNPKITVYHINDGTSEVLKIKRAKYDKSPINIGDIVHLIKIKQEGRWKNLGNDEKGKPIWEQDDTNKESILQEWSEVI